MATADAVRRLRARGRAGDSAGFRSYPPVRDSPEGFHGHDGPYPPSASASLAHAVALGTCHRAARRATPWWRRTHPRGRKGWRDKPGGGGGGIAADQRERKCREGLARWGGAFKGATRGGALDGQSPWAVDDTPLRIGRLGRTGRTDEWLCGRPTRANTRANMRASCVGKRLKPHALRAGGKRACTRAIMWALPAGRWRRPMVPTG